MRSARLAAHGGWAKVPLTDVRGSVDSTVKVRLLPRAGRGSAIIAGLSRAREQAG